jgi:hypothetical protein
MNSPVVKFPTRNPKGIFRDQSALSVPVAVSRVEQSQKFQRWTPQLRERTITQRMVEAVWMPDLHCHNRYPRALILSVVFISRFLGLSILSRLRSIPVYVIASASLPVFITAAIAVTRFVDTSDEVSGFERLNCGESTDLRSYVNAGPFMPRPRCPAMAWKQNRSSGALPQISRLSAPVRTLGRLRAVRQLVRGTRLSRTGRHRCVGSDHFLVL